MSTEASIVDFHVDDSLLYRSLKLRTRDKQIATPVRAVNPSQLRQEIQIRKERSSLAEIHKTLYENTQYFRSGPREGQVRIPSVKDIIKERSRQDDFEYRIDYLRRKCDERSIAFCILQYLGNRYPTKTITEYLCDTSYVYSDIVPIPAFSLTKEISSEDDFQKYLSFLEDYLEILETHNNKPIMGIVPNVARTYFDDLFEFYHDQGINCFYFDFEGKSPMSRQTNIRKFLRLLEEEGLFESSFLHSTNVYPARFLKSLDVINAKDILSFGLGFDSMGRNKRKPPPPDFFRKRIKPESKLRLFNKEDYGYYQIASKDMKRIYPSDTDIPLHTFSDLGIDMASRKYALQNNFNMEQQILECIRLRKVVRKESPEEYLRGKNHVEANDLERMKKVSTSVQKEKSKKGRDKRQASLF